ncbi:Phage minor structural protein GP20 [compost metagenome]
MKKSSGDAAELTKKIETLQAENKSAKEEYETKAKDLRTETALKLKLVGKVHENAMANVIAEFDKSKIILDENGEIKSGFDEQYKPLQESKGFYFVPEDTGGNQFQFKGFKPTETGGGSGGNGSGGKDAAADFGKKMAEFAKANNTAVEAQKHYFD